MTEVDREWLGHYIYDFEKWLGAMAWVCREPETPSDVAILSLVNTGKAIAAEMKLKYGPKPVNTGYGPNTARGGDNVKYPGVNDGRTNNKVSRPNLRIV